MGWKEILSDEIFWYFASIAWFIFIGVNVNTTLGVIYYGFPTTAILLALVDREKTIKFNKDGTWLKGFIQAAGFYVAFVILNLLLIPIYQKINIGGVISLLGATAPALAQSKIINAITFIVPVAFVETMATLRYFDYIATKLNIRIDRDALLRFNIPLYTLIAVFSFGFMILHLTAKGITNNAALLMVSVMMLFTLIMSIWYEEGKQGVTFHVVANGLAILTITGIIVMLNIMGVII